MDKPLITVLMPVYNAEKHLQEAMQSILNQTLTNFEFLIINDGSTDASVEIINSFSDSHIRLINNDRNYGITTTLNKGIDLSSAELIARMDADDISYPQRLKIQYDYLCKHEDCCLLSTDARVISTDKQMVRMDKFNDLYFYYNLNFICWIYHPTVMYRRSSVISAGKYGVPYSEDFDLWWKMTRICKLNHLNEVLLDYRLSDESLSTVYKKQEYEEAQHSQVIRNIQYYTGAGINMTYNEIECLRHNFDLLLHEKRYKSISGFLKKLDLINDAILKTENINLNIPNTIQAAHYKKQYIIDYFLSNLPFNKAIRLLFDIVPFNNLLSHTIQFFKKRFLTEHQIHP